jgi:intein/homing endonuclease
MNINEHNQKVAINRWSKIISEEKNSINHNLFMKSAICGFLAGDGYVNVRKDKNNIHYEIGFFPDDEVMLDNYCTFLNEVYHKKPIIKQINKMFDVRITSKTIVEDIMQLANFGHHKWSIPKSILITNEEIIAWLKAFFSAEGYVNSKTIRVQSVNKDSLKEVSNLLNILEIEHKQYNYTPKQKQYSPVNIITINKKEARRKYLEKIGFWHSKKQLLLIKALSL